MRKKITLVASLAFAAALCAGVATANVTAQAETDWANGLKVSATSVRLGTGTKEDPTGIRFKIDCPVDLRTNENAEYYTTLSFTADKAYTTDVPATYWRADASGWNTLLLEIPSQYYTMDITATAVVKLDGETYTATATSSIAKTASIVMNGGQKDAKLDAFVAGAVTDITLSEATATLQEGETVQLTATTAPAGYGVVWASDAEEVATVAADGTITAVSAGTANITATMSGVTKTCVVTVKGRTLYDFESAEQVALGGKLLKMGGSSAASTEWAVVEGIGAAENGALAITNTNWSRGMNLMMDTAWLKSVYETADYVSFDVYTDATNLEYVHIESTDTENALANASFYNRTWLHSQASATKVTGAPAGTYNDTAIYKYTFALPKARFEQSIKSSSMSTKLLFMFTNGTSVWAFDNFNVEGKYNGTLIDFNDGQANGVALPDWNGTKVHFQLAERVAGDYALTSTKSSGNDANFYMDVAYFVYAFHTLNAQSIQFTIYCEGVTSTTAGAFRIGLNNSTGSASGDKVAARTTANVSHVLDATNGSVTVTVTRAAYEYWFENGVYKNNANGVSSVQFIEMYTRMNGSSTYFLDNFQINR